MELYQIKRRLNMAIDTLRMNDNYLLINDVNERSMTHKLATYMEQTFGKTHDVDCEYNRNVGDLKITHMLKSRWDNINNNTMLKLALLVKIMILKRLNVIRVLTVI